jgi:hypothetical protein
VNRIINQLNANKFKIHGAVFLMIVFSSLGMYLAAINYETEWILVFLGISLGANILVVVIM